MAFSGMGISADAETSQAMLMGVDSVKPVLDSALPELAPQWDTNGDVLSCDIGNILYRNALPEGSFSWDFEDESDLTDSDELNKWQGGLNARLPQIISHDDVQQVIPEYVESDPQSDPARVEADVEGVPEIGGMCVEMANNTENWVLSFVMKVKLAKGDIRVGEPYTLSLWGRSNCNVRGIWADFRPFSSSEKLDAGRPVPWTQDKSFFDEDAHSTTNLPDWKTTKHWQKGEITITPQESDFNSDGYTTLWLVIHHAAVFQNADTLHYLYPGERYYIDNILLEPKNGIQETADFTLDIETADGAPAAAYIEVNGQRICETNDETGKLHTEFSIAADDEFVKGENRGTLSSLFNDKAKLAVLSDSGTSENFKVSLIKNVNRDISSKLSLRPVLLQLDIFSIGDQTLTLTEQGSDIDVRDGRGIYNAYILGEGSSTGITLKDGNGTVLGNRTYNYNRFFRNGVELSINNPSIIRELGPGRYVLEFNNYTKVKDIDIEVGYGNVSGKVSLNGVGLYMADLEFTQADIDALPDDAGVFWTDSSVTLDDFTMKKTADYE